MTAAPTTIRQTEQILAALEPDVTSQSVEAFGGLPVFLEPARAGLADDMDSFLTWFRSNEDELTDLLSAAGAVVFRGFPLKSTEDFIRFTEGFPGMDNGYLGGATRRSAIQGRVYESTSLPPTQKLALHQEMSYLASYPSKLAFYCRRPSLVGGETILADARRVTEHLPPGLAERLQKHGLRYLRNFRDESQSTGHDLLDAFHKPWQLAFETTDRGQAEKGCLALGVEYEWLPDGSLMTIADLPGFATHEPTGRKCWFNSLHAWANLPESIGTDHALLQDEFYSNSEMTRPVQVLVGDGSPVEAEDIRRIYRVLDEITVAFPWQANDVMIIDNVFTYHGRNPLVGKRDIQTVLIG